AKPVPIIAPRPTRPSRPLAAPLLAGFAPLGAFQPLDVLGRGLLSGAEPGRLFFGLFPLARASQGDFQSSAITSPGSSPRERSSPAIQHASSWPGRKPPSSTARLK